MSKQKGDESAFGVAAGSASPITDETWDKYNRRACGLHYVEHKMRGMETALRMAADALESDCDGDRRRAWNTLRDLLEPNAAGRPRDTCRGCAMSHHGAAYEADVESGRTIPGID